MNDVALVFVIGAELAALWWIGGWLLKELREWKQNN